MLNARVALAARLRDRQAEIEKTAHLRISSLSDPADEADPQYSEGLRAAVTAALDYGLSAIESDEEHPPIPIALLSQARAAARSGIPLERVLRSYITGYTLLCDFLIQEAEAGEFKRSASLQQIMQGPAALLDRLLADVSTEYIRESQARCQSVEERRVERIRRLLAGESLDVSSLGYPLKNTWHIGTVGDMSTVETLRGIAKTLGHNLLVVCPGKTAWAWLGGTERLDMAQIKRLVSPDWPSSLPLGLGEPGQGIDAWRLTHRQAKAAFKVAQRGWKSPVRYADVALLASALHDDLLKISLRQLYLDPLEKEQDGGKALRETLGTYIATGQHVSSTGTALNVDRRTVANRLRRIESRLGHPIAGAMGGIEVALRLHELRTDPAARHGSSPD